MARFYDKETENGVEFWFENGELDFQLHEDNLLANIHQDMTWDGWDRVAVEDPRDQAWWQWWKADFMESDQRRELFLQMASVAAAVGTILVRQTATVQLQNLFENSHQITDEEFNKFLGDDHAGTE